MYASFPTPLDHGAVRLAVVQPPAVIRAAAYEAADAVARALPAGVFSSLAWCRGPQTDVLVL